MRIVTCPHSQELERIEYELHELGTIIVACSHFSPRDALGCPRMCGAEIDRQRTEVPADVTAIDIPLGRVLERRARRRAG